MDQEKREWIAECVEEFTERALTVMGCTGENQKLYMQETFHKNESVRVSWENQLTDNTWKNISQALSIGRTERQIRRELKEVGAFYHHILHDNRPMPIWARACQTANSSI